METLMVYKFWGNINDKFIGWATEQKFSIPGFDCDVKVILNDKIDFETYTDIPPTEKQAAEYVKTFNSFIEHIDEIIDQMKEKSYEYFLKYRTDSQIDNADKHFEYKQVSLPLIF